MTVCSARLFSAVRRSGSPPTVQIMLRSSVIQTCIVAASAAFAAGLGSAHASCGDYLHTKHGAPGQSAAPMVGHAARALADNSAGFQFPEAVGTQQITVAEMIRNRPKRRCSGPECSQRLPKPAAPVTTPPAPRPPSEVLHRESVSSRVNTGRPFAPEADPSELQGFPPDIDHPPC